jgi:hypothetical protein
MRRSSRPRVAAELSKSLNDGLNAYALAAGAAGVGLLLWHHPPKRKSYTPRLTCTSLLASRHFHWT